MRAFISIEVPEDIRAKIVHMSEILQRSGLINAKFVDKDNLHLTLKFLGDISEEEIEKINDKLKNIDFNKFSAKVSGIGFFPSEDHIKVIWVGVHGDDIKKLSEKINDSLYEIGFTKENREFSSHLTIARVKGIKDKKLFQNKVSQLKFRPTEFNIDKAHLVKSELTRKGPKYKKLKEFMLY